MPPITLPPDLEVWAQAKVAANAAPSVDALVEETLRQRRALEELRASLDDAEAEAEREGWLETEDVIAAARAALK